MNDKCVKPKSNEDFLLWLKEIMQCRPKGNAYLESQRGIEVARLCIDFERNNYSWRRSDIDTFWIDVQLLTKYKLTDNEVCFVMKMQAGVDNYVQNSQERNAYAEMMRGIKKLRQINSTRELPTKE